MTPERWQEVKKVLAAALEREPRKRSVYLDEVCAEPWLRHEVESLIVAHEQGDASFLEQPAAEVGSLKRGTKLGPYEILAILGAGGMGIVYKAQDTKLGRLVALKFLPENLSTDAHVLERFQREARAASALNHPNICTIYDIEEYQGRLFIAMEYLDGKPLKDEILGRALESELISKLGTQIAEALAAAHSKGVIHRDIKPGNIIVTASGLVKVLDFGLAKVIRSQDLEAPTKSLTETDAVIGTMPYMSPEQLRGREVDARTDIYALGVVLYEMSTGRRPFNAELNSQLVDDILHSQPPLPREVNLKVSPKLEEIILKCLEKDPEDRYQSAKEIAVDLRRIITPSSATHRLVASQLERSKQVARILWVVVPILLLIVTIGWAVLRPLSLSATRSIAVLPLLDESKDESSQYIGDGITEGVIDKLSEIPSLRVMSRNSVFRFKGKETDAQSAGRDLHVQAVLMGRIVRQADGLTLRAELVNVSDGSQIWGRQFQYSLTDLSRAQDDVAAAVSDKLQLRLSSAEGTRLAKRVTSNPEAYQLYLQARYYLNQRRGPSMRKSIEFFQQATEKDPNFALAYAGLADAYLIAHNLGILAPKESGPVAKAAATKALVLDPQLGEAHSALGMVKSHYDYDLPGAEIEFKKAIQFNPNYATGRLFYAGGYLTPMGRHSEAIAEMKKALELDPLSLPLNNLMGNSYMQAGDFDKAVQQFQSTVELDPTFPMTHAFFSACLERIGKYEEAIAEGQKAELLSGDSPEEVETVAREFRKALQSGGARGYWQKTVEMVLKAYQRAGERGRYFPAFELAGAYAGVGDKEKALEWLEKSYAARDGNLISEVRSDPGFKGLHGDPRFLDLLKRMGLPNY